MKTIYSLDELTPEQLKGERIDADLDLRSLTTIPEGVTLTAGGSISHECLAGFVIYSVHVSPQEGMLTMAPATKQQHSNMSQPFFIAGLPRSGTAWLSAILTAHGMPCLHEGVKFVAKGETYLDMLKYTLGHGLLDFFGDAGAHIPLFYKEILESYPLANFVIINRSVNASKVSTIEHLAKIKFPDDEFGKQVLDGIDQCAKALTEMEIATPCAVLNFDYMFTSRGMNQIIRYLSGGEVKLDYTIFNIFSRVNIQATNESHNESYLAIKQRIDYRILPQTAEESETAQK